MATLYIDCHLLFISELELDKLQIGTHFLALAAAFALAIPIGWIVKSEREARDCEPFRL